MQITFKYHTYWEAFVLLSRIFKSIEEALYTRPGSLFKMIKSLKLNFI